MLTNFAELFDQTLTDVAITAHLLKHRSAPSVAHILAGLEHFRFRGQREVLTMLLAQSQVTLLDSTLAAPSRLSLALALPPALLDLLTHLVPLPATLTLAERAPLPRASAERASAPHLLAGLTSTTQAKLGAALVVRPVASLQHLAGLSGLDPKTVRKSLDILSDAHLIELELVQNRLYAIASAYAHLVHTFAVSPDLPTKPGSSATRPKLTNTRLNTDPFATFFDPFGYRWDQPPSARARHYAQRRR